MSIELHQDAVRRFFGAVMNRGNLAVAGDMMLPAFDDRDGFLGLRPGSSFEHTLRSLRDGFPDAYYIVDDLVADDRHCIAQTTFQGTHLGSFGGLAPTGRKVTVRGVHVFGFEGGLMASHGAFENVWSLLEPAGSELRAAEVVRRVGAVASPIW